MSVGKESFKCKQKLLYGRVYCLKSKEQIVCTSNHRLYSFRVRDGHKDGLCTIRFSYLVRKECANAPLSLLNLMLLLHHSGDVTGGWTLDPPRPVTHPESLTEEGAYGASEPPTSTILMAHVESLKQNSILELMQQSITDTS